MVLSTLRRHVRWPASLGRGQGVWRWTVRVYRPLPPRCSAGTHPRHACGQRRYPRPTQARRTLQRRVQTSVGEMSALAWRALYHHRCLGVASEGGRDAILLRADTESSHHGIKRVAHVGTRSDGHVPPTRKSICYVATLTGNVFVAKPSCHGYGCYWACNAHASRTV